MYKYAFTHAKLPMWKCEIIWIRVRTANRKNKIRIISVRKLLKQIRANSRIFGSGNLQTVKSSLNYHSSLISLSQSKLNNKTGKKSFCVSTVQIQKLVSNSFVRNSYQTAIVSGCPPEYCKNDYQSDPAYGIKGQILWNASVGIGELEDYCLVGIVHEVVALVDARVDGYTRYWRVTERVIGLGL